MRVKHDAIPGRYSYVSFKPVKTGEYHTFCTEYCGTNHWNMRAKLKVVSQTEFDAWLNDKSDELRAARVSPAERGQKHFVGKGCNSCHSLDGSRLVGPSLLGVHGKEREFEDGSKTVADENYIRTSILNPASKIVKGYPNAMVAYEGQLSEDELSDLIAFVKSLDESKAVVAEVAKPVEDLSKLSPTDRGFKIMTAKGCNACHSMDGTNLVGPSYKGLYGRTEKLADGSSVVADDAYIKESILNPSAKIVAGYQPVMPPYAGQLGDAEISDIIEYIKTLK
jgi:cytochrome c oxidase subunit 2